ncbi:MAG: MBL fold metallo-hydrolase [Flavipsychrobacter sp.]|nr:MBL fold metallo-hydrolase [Flavipsychrobacter sp.]
MKITFKDVGQGDSILLEWCTGGTNKIGIVDCNLRGKKNNPVVSYLESKSYTRIEFIILSHPHSDHYSGMLGLLEYAEHKNVYIERIGSTFMLGDLKDYFKYFEITPHETDLLTSVRKKWVQMIKSNKIGREETLMDGKTMRIDNDVTLVSIAPSMQDVRDYQRIVKLDAKVNAKEASRAANLLSTLIKVTYKNYNYLLTSDMEKASFLRAYTNEIHQFNGVNFHVCQIPHHGSKKNYAKEFWSNIANFKIQNAIASAGEGYRHPSLTVLKAFYNSGYEVYCTNIVNGMEDFVKIVFAKQKALNTFSTPAPEYTTANDRAFIIKNNTVIIEK